MLLLLSDDNNITLFELVYSFLVDLPKLVVNAFKKDCEDLLTERVVNFNGVWKLKCQSLNKLQSFSELALILVRVVT